MLLLYNKTTKKYKSQSFIVKNSFLVPYCEIWTITPNSPKKSSKTQAISLSSMMLPTSNLLTYSKPYDLSNPLRSKVSSRELKTTIIKPSSVPSKTTIPHNHVSKAPIILGSQLSSIFSSSKRRKLAKIINAYRQDVKRF